MSVRRTSQVGAVIAAVCAASISAAIPALGADRMVVLPRQVPAPAGFDWSGVYFGGHVGYSRGNAQVTLADPDVTNFGHSFGSLTGGVQVGYNYVLPSRILLGVEADFSFMNSLSADDVAWFRTTAVTDIAEKVDYMGTLRGRLGYAFQHWMIYATGGYAWSLGRFLQTPGAIDDQDKLLHLHSGWSVGAGTEVALAPMWTLRLEYLYRASDTPASTSRRARSPDRRTTFIPSGPGSTTRSDGREPTQAPASSSVHRRPNFPIGKSTDKPRSSSRAIRHSGRLTSARTALRHGRRRAAPGPPVSSSGCGCGRAASSTTIPSCCRASACTTRPAPAAIRTAKRRSRIFRIPTTTRRACSCARRSGSAASRKRSRAVTAKWPGRGTYRGSPFRSENSPSTMSSTTTPMPAILARTS